MMTPPQWTTHHLPYAMLVLINAALCYTGQWICNEGNKLKWARSQNIVQLQCPCPWVLYCGSLWCVIVEGPPAMHVCSKVVLYAIMWLKVSCRRKKHVEVYLSQFLSCKVLLCCLCPWIMHCSCPKTCHYGRHTIYFMCKHDLYHIKDEHYPFIGIFTVYFIVIANNVQMTNHQHFEFWLWVANEGIFYTLYFMKSCLHME